MRQIEKAMVNAIKNRKNFKTSNTEVYNHPYSDVIYVELHGNCIAEVFPHYVTISACGWASTTTKSRLNALLDGLGINARVYQKDFTWYIENNGNTERFLTSFGERVRIRF